MSATQKTNENQSSKLVVEPEDNECNTCEFCLVDMTEEDTIYDGDQCDWEGNNGGIYCKDCYITEEEADRRQALMKGMWDKYEKDQWLKKMNLKKTKKSILIENEALRIKIGDWLSNKDNHEGDIIDFLVEDCGVEYNWTDCEGEKCGIDYCVTCNKEDEEEIEGEIILLKPK